MQMINYRKLGYIRFHNCFHFLPEKTNKIVLRKCAFIIFMSHLGKDSVD